MDSVIKAAVAYFLLWLVIRASGRRTLGQLTVFDLILFLVIGGVMARALMGQDYSLTTAFLVIVTFVIIDVLLSFVERDVPNVGRMLKGVPTILVENGHVLTGRLRRARVTEDAVLEAARHSHGLERMDQIKFAILEASGTISIIPRAPGDKPEAPAAAG